MASGKIEAIITATDKNFSSTIDKLRRKSDSLGSRLKSGLEFGVFQGIGMKAIGAVTTAMGALTAQVGDAVKRVDTLNNFPKIMSKIGFSTEEAEKSIKRLSDGVDGLPTTLDDIVSTAQGIALISGDLTKATDIALALNNAFLASGASAADTSRAMTQYNQMLAKGKPDQQSWNTLLETMSPALNQVAESFGYTGRSAKQQLYKALQDGTITFDQFNDKLVELNNGVNGFAEQAKAASGGIATSFTNIKTSVTKGIANAIQEANRYMKDNGLPTIQDTLEKIKGAINGAFSAITKSRAFQDVISAFGKLTNWLETAIPKAVNAVKPYFEVLWEAVKEVGSAFAEAFSAVFDSATDMNNAASGAESLRKAITPLKDLLKNVAGFIKDNADWIGKLITKLPAVIALWISFKVALNIADKIRDVVGGIKGLVTSIKDFGKACKSSSTVSFFTNKLKSLKSSVDNADKATYTFSKNFTTASKDMGVEVKGLSSKVVSSSKKSLSSATTFTTSFTSGLSGVSSASKKASSAIKTGATNITTNMSNCATKVTSSTGKLGSALSKFPAMGGLISAGVGLAITGIVSWFSYLEKENERLYGLSEEQKDLVEKVKSNAQEYNDSIQERKANYAVYQQEEGKVSSLVEAYKKLLDKNGQVKKGYEERANIIKGELASAVGIEKENLDSLIKKYGDVKVAAEKALEAKKLQASYDMTQETGKSSAAKLAEEEQNYIKLLKERNDIQKKYDEDSAKRQKSITSSNGRNIIASDNKKLKESLDKMNDALQTSSDNISKYRSDVTNADKAFQAQISGDAKTVEEMHFKMANGIISAGDASVATLKKQADSARDTYQLLKSALAKGEEGVTKSMVNNAKKTMDLANKEYKKGAQASTEAINKGLDNGKNNLSSKAIEVANLINAPFADLLKQSLTNGEGTTNNLAKGINNKKSAVSTSASAIKSLAYNPLASLMRATLSVGATSAYNFAQGINSKKGAAKISAQNVSNNAESGLKNHSSFDRGKDFSQGFINGLWSLANSVWNTAKNLALKAMGALYKTGDCGSPSKKTRELGKWYGQGFKNGLDGEIKSVSTTSEEMAKAAMGGLKAMDELVIFPTIDKMKLDSAQTSIGASLEGVTNEMTINVPLYVNGREFAKATNRDMSSASNQYNQRLSRKVM